MRCELTFGGDHHRSPRVEMETRQMRNKWHSTCPG
jgi:hypothetical protein